MQKEKKVLPSRKQANEGDVILFDRKDKQYDGKVVLVRENSVMVEISEEAAKTLGYDKQNTVVGHNNYIIYSRK